MDIDLSATLEINIQDQSELYNYLRDVSNNSQFATSILQGLIEERQHTRRTRWNNQRLAEAFKVGDVVIAHVQFHSNSLNGDVKKLSYETRGPFHIKEVLEACSYVVVWYNNSSSTTRNYKETELYFSPPSLFSHEPIDAQINAT